MTGTKSIDQLIQRYGILSKPGKDPLQRLTYLCGGDKGANALPYCMFNIIMNAPVSRRFTVHHFYHPTKKCRLATFLFDEKGQLIEQVYYAKVARWVELCRKLQRLVIQSRKDIQFAA